ncbi:hypothetical protein Tco_0400059 [Tanacetum coccineum]
MSQINSECLFFDDTDDETEVNSLLSGFLIDAALVIQASTPTIQKYQRSYMPRDRYGAHDRLVLAYFAKKPFYNAYLFQGCDAVGKAGISALVKCTSAIRQLAYAAVPDSLDEYLQIGEKTSRDCLMQLSELGYRVIWHQKQYKMDCGLNVHKHKSCSNSEWGDSESIHSFCKNGCLTRIGLHAFFGVAGHDLPHVVEENDLRFKDRMTDVYYKDSLADRAVARFNRTRKVQKKAVIYRSKAFITGLVMLLNNHGRITRPMVFKQWKQTQIQIKEPKARRIINLKSTLFKRVEAYPRHIVAAIQRVQSLSGLPDGSYDMRQSEKQIEKRNRARELHARALELPDVFLGRKIGGHEGKNIFSWYLREVGTDLCTVQQIGAQCALEEREVVEHRTVDADYEYEIEPAMQYELKIVGFHHFDTMIVILSSPLRFRVLEGISDNILAIKTTNVRQWTIDKAIKEKPHRLSER